jgi:hypothetical protein
LAQDAVFGSSGPETEEKISSVDWTHSGYPENEGREDEIQATHPARAEHDVDAPLTTPQLSQRGNVG